MPANSENSAVATGLFAKVSFHSLAVMYVGSSLPDKESDPHPTPLEGKVLTTGLVGKSPENF